MRRPVDPRALTEVGAVLGRVGEGLAAAEDDLLSCLVVMGEPDPQRALDGWVDQVVDVLRAVDEVTAQHRATIARSTARRGDPLDAPSDEPAGSGPR
ncbi:hypothetical protein ACOCJ4_12935 [Knoellia sp. CPCC 206435]|uniref:hypothetical protein n=1 Tax=Knoellia terrae TaxID=3404797 RepID=UPI003B433B58